MNFDLNIDNYTKHELTEMFELPKEFDQNIIEMQEAKMKDSILKNKDIPKDIQKKTLEFIVKAKNVILNSNSQSDNNPNEASVKFLKNVYGLNNNLAPTPLQENNGHMIQDNPDTPYVNSNPASFFAGIVNPIKKRSVQKILSIDTRFRNNYYSTLPSNFVLNLPTNFNNVLQMQLLSFEIPQVYFLISKNYGNDFFNITVNGLSATVIIPQGNYDPNTIATIINQSLTNLGGDFANVVFSCNYINFTNVPTGTGQMMVGFNGLQTNGANATLELNFQANINGIADNATPLPLKLGWLLGFRNGIYINNQNYVSEGIVDYIGSRYFYLIIDDYNVSVVNNFYAAFNSSILNKNIIARISTNISTTTQNYILEQVNNQIVAPIREYFGPVNINNLNIQLVDEFGRFVELNNMDYSFTLSLTTVYDI
jgi:hypothetical protein